MTEFLQQLDLEYYRSALLLVARADLARLRRDRSSRAEVDRRREIPPGTPRSAGYE